MAKLPRITRTGIERIKADNSLVEVLAERGIETKRKGRHLFALCPFHPDKDPSLVVTPAKGLYHCFGCGEAGDVIRFVERYEGYHFVDACLSLGRRAGYSPREILERDEVRAW